jgi:hypothetical protein
LAGDESNPLDGREAGIYSLNGQQTARLRVPEHLEIPQQKDRKEINSLRSFYPLR